MDPGVPPTLMAEICDVVPMNCGFGGGEIGVAPPLPASATYKVPLGAKSRPLGFNSPVATTVGPGSAGGVCFALTGTAVMLTASRAVATAADTAFRFMNLFHW